MSDDYKAQFAAAVDELWASDLNARIGELNAEIRRWKHELRMVKSDEIVAEKIEDDLDTMFLWLAQLFAEKNRRVDELIERYIAATGERPDSRQLNRLATWLLKGVEGDGTLTASQWYRRRKRELPDALIDEKVFVDDGNSWREPKPRMDGDGSHFEYVRFPSDGEDKRRFNGNLRKYNVNTDVIWRKNSD